MIGSTARLLVGFALLLLAGPPGALAVETLSPEEERQTFSVPDGFEVNLFAAEEMGVLNPMQMRWDAGGNLYVISSLGYPQLRPGEQPNDKIIKLTDTDGDGRADRSHVFAEGLNIPTGLEVGDGGLYVGEQTDLLFLKDHDGDGVAEKKVVLSGFGVGDTHQAINSFVWSPGGELYFDQGDGIESRVETPWGLSGLFQAGVMRFRPRRLQLDPFLDDFMGPGNPWGIAFDDWGQTFVVDGAGGVTFLSPAMMPVRHRRRLRTIGKPGGYCGVDILGSEHLPDDFQGDFLVGDFHRNRIGRFTAKPNGSGFTVQWKDPLLVSSHRNFRPVDVRTGPDGAIYICDWYNSVICHQDDPFRHPDRDVTHGRIWRVSNKRAAKVTQPDLQNATVLELYDHLKSPERWTRYQAKRILASPDPALAPEHVAGLLAGTFSGSRAHEQDEHLLFEIIGVLESLEVVNEALLSHLVVAEDHRARAYSARVVGRWSDRLGQPLKLLEKLIHDPHPQVRMEAIVACAHVTSPHAAEVAAIAADYDIDYDIDYALSQALHHLQDLWVPAFQRGELSFGGHAHRIAEVLKRVKSDQLVTTLRRMVAEGSARDAATRLAAAKALVMVGGQADVSLVFERASASSIETVELLEAFEQGYLASGRTPKEPLRKLKELIGSSESAIQARAIRLAGLWKVDELTARLAELVKVQSGNVHETSLHALGRLGGNDAKKLLERYAQQGDDVRLQVSSIAALAQTDLNSASTLAVRQFLANSLNDQQLDTLARAFAGRKDGLQRLTVAMAQQSLSKASAQRLLDVFNAIGQTTPELIALLSGAANLSASLPEYGPEAIAEIASKLSQGDPHRGEQLFRSRSTNCYACHQVGGVGGQVGPDLSAVGTTLPLDRLIQEVLWPQRLVKEGYTLRQVITEDGQVLQGYLRKAREKESILLRPLDSTELISVRKEIIEHQQDVGSAMPDNIVATLTEQERIDLLRFLSELGKPGEFNVTDKSVIRLWNAKSGNDWTPTYSTVSGKLPLSELQSGTTHVELRSRFQTKVERRRLQLEDPTGLNLWLDGEPVIVDENIDLRFEAGSHELRVVVDMKARPKKWLRAEWQQIE